MALVLVQSKKGMAKARCSRCERPLSSCLVVLVTRCLQCKCHHYSSMSAYGMQACVTAVANMTSSPRAVNERFSIKMRVPGQIHTDDLNGRMPSSMKSNARLVMASFSQHLALLTNRTSRVAPAPSISLPRWCESARPSAPIRLNPGWRLRSERCTCKRLLAGALYVDC